MTLSFETPSPLVVFEFPLRERRIIRGHLERAFSQAYINIPPSPSHSFPPNKQKKRYRMIFLHYFLGETSPSVGSGSGMAYHRSGVRFPTWCPLSSVGTRERNRTSDLWYAFSGTVTNMRGKYLPFCQNFLSPLTHFCFS